MSEAPDQPVAEETPAPGVEADTPEIETEGEAETELDEDGNPVDPEDEDEEIEHDGAKYRLPKVLAKEFREGTLRQSDYTRKTQEVAQQREALAARQTELAQQAEAQQTTLDERAALKAVESSLRSYQDMDWAAYMAQNGSDATVLAQSQWRQLEAYKGQLSDEITRKETDHRSKREQATATALREAVTVLQRDIPSFTPELATKIDGVAANFGFTPAELRDSLVGADGKPDVRAVKVLARLHEVETRLAKYEAKDHKAQTAQKVAAVQPAKTVGQRAGGYKPGLDDSLPIDEWMRRANAAAAKAGRH